MTTKPESGKRKPESSESESSLSGFRSPVSGLDRWFFSDAGALQRLRTEAATWLKTPFRPYSRAKGPAGGTDCVGLCEALMLASGVIEKEFKFPRTPADYSRHVHNDKILSYLRGQIDDEQSATLAQRFAEIDLSGFRSPLSGLLAGDLAILRTGIGLYHMPVMLTDRAFIQCAPPLGVTEGDITAPNYADYLVAFFRARAITPTLQHSITPGAPPP